jgi:hypothetical protein
MGEKYRIAPLKDLAQTKTKNILTREWTPAYFFGAVNEVFESTITKDRGLRVIYVQVAVAQGPRLFTNEEVQEGTDQNGQFWKDYAKALSDKYTPFMGQTQIKCQSIMCHNEYGTLKLSQNSPEKQSFCPSCGSINSRFTSRRA